MKKIFPIIIILAIILVVLYILLRLGDAKKDDNSISPQDGLKPYYALLKDAFGLSDDDRFAVEQFYIPSQIKELESPSGLFTYKFIELPILSGNGGANGVILQINNKTGEAIIVSDFFGFFNNSSKFLFNPNEGYLAYNLHANSGGSCSYNSALVVNISTTTTNSLTLEVPIDMANYAPYVDEYKFKVDPYTYAKNLRWINNEIIVFDAVVRTCEIRDKRGDLYISQWQYNVETGE